MRKGFLIKGPDLYHMRDTLFSYGFRYIKELKAYGHLTPLCDPKGEEKAKDSFRRINFSQKLQLIEVPADELIKHFPKELEKQKNGTPFEVIEMFCGASEHDTPYEKLFKTGSKIWAFKTDINDRDIIYQVKQESYNLIAQNKKLGKLSWEGTTKTWVTDNITVKDMLLEKLNKKYEAYIMDQVLKKAFEETNE